MSICEQCGKEHDGSFGSGRFCSRSCSNKWVALNQSPEAKARKIEAGKLNLELGRSNPGHNFTLEDRRKGARKSAEVKRGNRRAWLESVLSGDPIDVYYGGYGRLKSSLVEFGYKSWVCDSCGLSSWLGKEISLELHHKDGDGNNNVLSNLQLLCPNCHSQTDNYRWRKVKNSCNGIE